MRSSRVGFILLTLLLAITPAAYAQAPAASPGTQGDFAGLVDIGGRRIYLECRGQGSPTVVLVAGKGSSAAYWTDDLRGAASARTMVFPAVATTTRVCAYDRPGTYAEIDEISSSAGATPSPNPRPRWTWSPISTPC